MPIDPLHYSRDGLMYNDGLPEFAGYDKEDALREAGVALRAARVEEAESFLRHRLLVPSDNQARARAIIETQSALDMALTEWEIAKSALADKAELARED